MSSEEGGNGDERVDSDEEIQFREPRNADLEREISALKLELQKASKDYADFHRKIGVLRHENEKMARSMVLEKAKCDEKERQLHNARVEGNELRCQLHEAVNKRITRPNENAQSATGSHYDVPMPRCTIFDGKSSWEGFIRPFRSLSTACGWDTKEKHFRLINSLRGEAAEFVYTQLSGDELDSYEKLVDALETRFKEQRTITSYLAELENRKLGASEKLAEYVADIKRLVLKGFPSANVETRETINLRYFLKGLQDQNMAVAVGMKDPKTVEEAKTALETYRSLRDEINSTKPKVRVVSQQDAADKTNRDDQFVTKDDLKKFGDEIVQSLQLKLGNPTFGRRTYNNDRTGPRRQGVRQQQRDLSHVECYNCHENGHIARDCPANRSEEIRERATGARRETNEEN